MKGKGFCYEPQIVIRECLNYFKKILNKSKLTQITDSRGLTGTGIEYIPPIKINIMEKLNKI